MSLTPFVVGQWVRAERFYGREDLLDEILNGQRNCLWILGTRRIGKTSVLKQLDHLVSHEAVPRYFPVFWDFQGAEEVEDLHQGFSDALLDAADRLEALGLDPDELEGDDLSSSLGKLRRELRARGLTLLLLCDEVEELVQIYLKNPRFLSSFGRALRSAEGIRTVFASTIRLWNLASEEIGESSFLDGFTPPLAIRGLDDPSARELLRQSQLPAEVRPNFSDEAIDRICAMSGHHPYLLQLLGERLLETGDLEPAIDEIANNQMVSFFFATDLGMLSHIERKILRSVHEQGGCSSESIQRHLALDSASFSAGLQRLDHLGFLVKVVGKYRLVNPIFSRWFNELSVSSIDVSQSAEAPTVRMSVARPVSTQVAAAGHVGLVDDRYELLQLLGSGASGDVYKARDQLLDNLIAIKWLKHSTDQEAIGRLRREVVLSRELSHPNILKVFHLGDVDDRRYITMQLVEGSDLSKIILKEAPLAARRAVEIGHKVAGALSMLHRHGVLHRDVKPSNVLIDLRGEPLLTDFGLARRAAGPEITREGIFLGTPAYASPEQASGDHLDERSDLYSLGAVLFELVTGRPPFVADTVFELLRAHLESPPPVPRELVVDLSAGLSELILRCLEKKPDARFATAAELELALVELASRL